MLVNAYPREAEEENDLDNLEWELSYSLSSSCYKEYKIILRGMVVGVGAVDWDRNTNKKPVK